MLAGRFCLVTGSSRGIGRSISTSLARYGGSVIIHSTPDTEDSLKSALESLPQEYGQGHSAVTAEFSSLEGVEFFCESIKKNVYKLDCIVLNAAILGPNIELNKYSKEEFDRVMQVNTKAHLIIVQELLPLLKKGDNPTIVFVSCNEKKLFKRQGAYCASKAAFEEIARTFAKELSKDIHVHIVFPGFVMTELACEAFQEEEDLKWNKPIDITPIFVWLARGDTDKYCTRMIQYNAVDYIGADPTSNYLGANHSKRNSFRVFARELIVNGVRRGVTKSLLAPLETVKLFAQESAWNMRKDYNFQSLRNIAEVDGIGYLWKGNAVNVLKYYPVQILQFICKKIFKQSPKEHFYKRYERIFVETTVGLVSLLISHPIDLVRTKLTLDFTEHSFWNCFKNIVATNGFLGLYSGFGTSLLGFIPYKLLQLSCQKVAKSYTGRRGYWEQWIISQMITTLAQLITFPFDSIRRAQMVLGLPFWNCVNLIMNQRGKKGFYYGVFESILQANMLVFLLALFDRL